jgi:hypothetical protein
MKMKSLIITCMLCLVGCGAAPITNDDPVTGTTSPDLTAGDGGSYAASSDDLAHHCGEWHWVTVWQDGQPTAQLQPIICVSGKNPNTGDPAPKVVDPNPWEQNLDVMTKNQR